jgi:hypothetical protein
MIRRNAAILAMLFLLAGCAQVPKESVELSATVGRDLAAVHEAHREAVQLLFTRMREDINRFIDDVYAPHQIKVAMARQQELSNSPSQAHRSKSLLLGIYAAFREGASPEMQDAVLQGMGFMVAGIRNDVESMRAELLTPVNEHEQEVMNSIDMAYQQIHYANSIVTGHLASVAKVHDAQAGLMSEIGLSGNLRVFSGETLSGASVQISELLSAAEDAESNIPEMEKNLEQLKETLQHMNSEPSVKNEDTE